MIYIIFFYVLKKAEKRKEILFCKKLKIIFL